VRSKSEKKAQVAFNRGGSSPKERVKDLSLFPDIYVNRL